MPDTALHRALNVRNRDITADDLKAAIDLEIRESDDLDWKKVLPAKAPNTDQAAKQKDFAPDREFAKDVAAMANSGGGTIVFGIEEDRATSAALSIFGAGEWGDGVERKLRSWAASIIQPPVYNLDISAVATTEGPVVIVHVPASPQAPHFVSQTAETYRVPRRTGTKTVFMAEREIEAAYRARFRAQSDREAALTDHVVRAGKRVQGEHVAIVTVASPANGRPPFHGPITPYEFSAIATAMRTTPNRFIVGDDSKMHTPEYGTRRGLRRWILEYPGRGGGVSKLLEVHDSGIVVLATQLRPRRDMDEHADVHEWEVHLGPAYMAQLVETAAEVLGMSGDFDVRFRLSSTTDAIWIRQYDHDELIDKEDLLPVTDVEPIDAVFTISSDPDVLLEQVRGLALDALNSGGINRIRPDVLKAPKAISTP